MTKITTLNKAALVGLREPIEAELKALGERLGLTLTLGNGSYSPAGAEASFKLEIKVDDPATKDAAAKMAWDRDGQYLGYDFGTGEGGLRPEDRGTEFVYGGTTLKTVSIAQKGRGSQKFPILCQIIAGGPKHAGKEGQTLMLPEAAVKIIRQATDAKANGLPGFSGFADAKRAEASA